MNFEYLSQLVDAADSKSTECMLVGVQVPSLAPFFEKLKASKTKTET